MTLAPASIGEVQEAVTSTSPAPLRVAGKGTKRPIGRSGSGEATEARVIDMRGVTGITAYDPAECVATVLAGTPVAQVAAALADHGQYLPWDPPGTNDGATIGGMVASGLNGPGRYRYGGVRDFVIGARVVDGRGRLIASGGQVVKNAAGFLTHHALVGSAGRLGVIVEVSFKVFPTPEATCTLVARAPSLADALSAHERLRCANLDLDALDLDARAGTVLARVAGAADALAGRAERAAGALSLPANTVAGPDEAAVWAAVRPARAVAGCAVVKVPTTPARLPTLLDRLSALGDCRVSVGGAVLYVSGSLDLDAIALALAAHGARGMVVGGPGHGRALGRASGTAFHDRVRRSLDPDARFR